MTDEKRLKIGQIGVGGFGNYRRTKLRETGLFEMVACCDANPETLQKAVAEEGAKACASYDDMLAIPEIEGIVIATGANTHCDFAVRAMRAGKHVFVEKPLCTSIDEVKLLRQVQSETGRVVGVGHGDNRDDPGFLLARRYIDDGLLGTVASYEENSSHSGGLEINPGDWRGLADRNPGGMLFQCGVHSLHRLTALFGPVSELSSMMRFDVHTTETADVASVLIRHASGITGTLNCYHVTAYCHEFRIFGTKANLYISSTPPSAYFQERKRGDPETRVPVELPTSTTPGGTGNLVNWYKEIRGTGKARPSLEDGIQSVLPVFAAEVSAKSERLVRLAAL